MTGPIPTPPADLAIALACVAGFAILLVFVGLHQILQREVHLADRLGRWGGSAHVPISLAGEERATLRNRLDNAVAKRSFAATIQRDLARAIAHSKGMEQEARVAELERALAETRGSLSWRLTAPLRRLAPG